MCAISLYYVHAYVSVCEYRYMHTSYMLHTCAHTKGLLHHGTADIWAE